MKSVEHRFWMGAIANPPKNEDIYAQLTRGAFLINDFLQNPHFNLFSAKNKAHSALQIIWLVARGISLMSIMGNLED